MKGLFRRKLVFGFPAKIKVNFCSSGKVLGVISGLFIFAFCGPLWLSLRRTKTVGAKGRSQFVHVKPHRVPKSFAGAYSNTSLACSWPHRTRRFLKIKKKGQRIYVPILHPSPPPQNEKDVQVVFTVYFYFDVRIFVCVLWVFAPVIDTVFQVGTITGGGHQRSPSGQG